LNVERCMGNYRLLQAARGEVLDRLSSLDDAPSWSLHDLSRFAPEFPSFRERSENPDLAVISLQPHAFKPDGVIMFSDILTPCPALVSLLTLSKVQCLSSQFAPRRK